MIGAHASRGAASFMRVHAAVCRRQVATALLAAAFAQKDVHIGLCRIFLADCLVRGESLELRSEVKLRSRSVFVP